MPTPQPDLGLSSLQQIIIKVRRLTRSLSPTQLTDQDITNYINTFVLYDFPQHLRTFDLQTTLKFYTQPGIDVYSTNITNPNDPLYNFSNIYVSVNPPAYCAGFLMTFSQSRQQFFSIWPKINSIQLTGFTGDGLTNVFVGRVNTTGTFLANTTQQQIFLLQNDVLFDSIDIDGNGLSLVDVPNTNPAFPLNEGYLVVPNTPVSALDLTLPPSATNNYINYTTGDFRLTFPTAPAAGVSINSQTVYYSPSRPQSLLFFQDKFIVRPVPDQPYRIDVEVYKRPAELLAGSTPEISEWWQYIAYGAAKKVFEDRMDLDSVQLIMPEFKKQEALALRKTIVQNTNERVSTIFSDQINLGPDGMGWGGTGWGGF